MRAGPAKNILFVPDFSLVPLTRSEEASLDGSMRAGCLCNSLLAAMVLARKPAIKAILNVRSDRTSICGVIPLPLLKGSWLAASV